MPNGQADELVVLLLEWLQREELDDTTPIVSAKTATVVKRVIVSIVPPGCYEGTLIKKRLRVFHSETHINQLSGRDDSRDG